MTTADTTPDVDVDPDPLNPLIEGDVEYSVRLVFRVNAANPLHARDRFIQHTNEFGLNTWTYRATEVDTGDEFFIQNGVVYTPEEFAAKQAEEDDEEAEDEATIAAAETEDVDVVGDRT